MTATRWASVLAVVATLAAGCGGDDTGGSATNLDDAAATSTSVAGGGSTTSAPGGGASAAACEVQGGVATAGTDVQVNLTEWKVEPSVAKAAPGIVTFVAENSGADPHELVVVKGDSADALPKDANGALDEAKLPEGALVGEIEEMAPTQVCKGNFPLAAGTYVLVCNVVEKEEGMTEAHLAEGMHTTFTAGA